MYINRDSKKSIVDRFSISFARHQSQTRHWQFSMESIGRPQIRFLQNTQEFKRQLKSDKIPLSFRRSLKGHSGVFGAEGRISS